MAKTLISVVETAAYLRRVERMMTEDERSAVVDLVAADPECGDRIRKIRVGFGGRGKRGGARVIYFYHHDRMPVFLLTAFAKNERVDLA
jgi:hypothetical protein